MIYSDLVKICELDKELSKKYGKTMFNIYSQKEIGWPEIVTIIRFGQEFHLNPLFLEERKICGSPKSLITVREDLLNSLPDWLVSMKIMKIPLKVFTTEEELEFMIRNEKTIVSRIGQEKYNYLKKLLIDYIENKKKNS